MKKSTSIIIVVIAILVVLAGIGGFMMINHANNSNSNSGTSNSTSGTTGSETSTIDLLKQEVSLADINYDSDKINIYLFWGNGCSICESFLEFMVENYDEYEKYFNFYAFEIWYDDDNHALFEALADSLGATANAVPFYVIGTKNFTGFSSSKSNEVLETIVSEYENRANADKSIEEFLKNYQASESENTDTDDTGSETSTTETETESN